MSVPSLRLAMNGPLPIVPAEFLQLQLLGRGLLVLRRRVVATFALGALERDDLARCRHCLYPEKSFWSPRRDLNSGPRPYQGRALPLSYEGILLFPIRRLERETGFEPATNSLEGCDSTN